MLQGQPLDILDRPRAADALRADLGAVELGPTVIAGGKHRIQPLLEQAVPLVRQQREGPVQRSRSGVAVVIMAHGAARDAAAARYAVGGHADVLPLAGPRRDDSRFGRFFPRFEIRHCLFVFSEERLHVHDQVLDDRKMVERTEGDLLAARDVRDVRLAGEAFLAVDDHAARAAHVHPARKAKRQGGILLLLDPKKNVQHRGGGLVLNAEPVAVEVSRCRPAAGRIGILLWFARSPVSAPYLLLKSFSSRLGPKKTETEKPEPGSVLPRPG